MATGRCGQVERAVVPGQPLDAEQPRGLFDEGVRAQVHVEIVRQVPGSLLASPYNQGWKGRAVHIVILGCGRVGARIANSLHATHRTTIIDWNVGAFDRLKPDFSGETFVGNGIDVDVLRLAGIGDADLFLALTDGDNRNLMAAQIAQRLGARKIIIRVYDPVRCGIYSGMGMSTFSPTVSAAERLFQLVVGDGEE